MAGALTAAIAAAFSGGGSPPVTTDPYFEYTTLLLPGNGTNLKNNNEFLDSSTNAFTITRNPLTGPNAPTQGTFSPFSQTGWGNYFDGGGDYLNVTDAAFNPSGAFTIELWFYPTDNTTTYQGLVSTWPDGLAPAQGIQIWKASTTGQVSIGNASTGGTTIASFTWSSYLNQWNHLAVVRNSSNSCAVFLNGTRLAVPVTKSGSPGQTTLTIGRAFPNNANYYFQGYMSNVSFVSGSNVYDPASSTITVPTTPLSTSTANQALLTCQANRFVDSNTATTAKTITVNGNPSVQAFSPFNPTASWSAVTNGGSGYFDGSGDYLTASGNSAFAFGTGDFTVEAWIYLKGTLPFTIASFNYNYSSGSGNWAFYANTNQLWFNIPGQNHVSNTFTFPTNAWTHVAYSRVGTAGYFFVNGVSIGPAITDTGNYSGTTGSLFIGRQSDGTGQLNGYMSDLRILKGTGYSSITVPTAPLTAITNTSLLLNFTNAGIYDATSKNDLETLGAASISTAQSKWGGSSMVFNGSTSALKGPSTDLVAFGTGDFTVEAWAYRTATSDGFVFDTRNNGVGLRPNTSNQLEILVTFAGPLTAGGTWPANQWVHIAATRTGGNIKLWLDGVNVATAANSTNMTGNTPFVGSANGSNYFPGYIQDLRVTKGYARYTSNFTPPTAAFPTL